MNFKPSAGIFVAGLVTSIAGALLAVIAAGISGSASSGAGAGAAGMGFVSFAVSVAGLVMMCVGARRALLIIDSLPAAFSNLISRQGQPSHQPTPAPQQAHQQFPQNYSPQPHMQPQHQGYTQLPPVE
ncbi:hypothetical protein ACIP9X_05610 [Arthrobacter sp. NPDC093125]|uniref:hypothetical protein n=1 Tax=Arthrobacter sp. NPDC093125 TaxID=3363944 RepID=UPI003821D61B